MKIYTRTGDRGTTSLIGGKIVPKTNGRIEAYGTVDELISYLAYLRDFEINEDHKVFLLKVLEDLMVISSILATDDEDVYKKLPKLSAGSVVRIEQEIDRLESKLPVLAAFVIPGGHQACSVCHIARTVCRRTERVVLSLADTENIPEIILRYLNRLSDYLFTLSRAILNEFGIKEIIWKPELDK